MGLPKSLVEGYRRFLRDRHTPERGRYMQLAELGQTPTAMVIACCDARVDVSAIFDAGPGELFILRNVANLVPPYEPEGKFHGTSAAVEYAALVLKVPHIIISAIRIAAVLPPIARGSRATPTRTASSAAGSPCSTISSCARRTRRDIRTRRPSSSPASARRSPICAASPRSVSARRRGCSRCTASISTSPAAR